MFRERSSLSGESHAQNHYSVYELARLWKLSPRTVKSLFLTEPGVLVIPSHPTQISIPAVYGVFLAHNSRDKIAVETIAQQLRHRGLNPWFDKWNIPPGRIFQREINHALRTARSIAVFIGPRDFGRWEQLEMEAAIG